jgi:DNA end-binding protein Ku
MSSARVAREKGPGLPEQILWVWALWNEDLHRRIAFSPVGRQRCNGPSNERFPRQLDPDFLAPICPRAAGRVTLAIGRPRNDRPPAGLLRQSSGERTMAPRAYWKGYLRLSLVTCPIELFPASSEAEKTHFHQINKRTGHRLRQQMIDEKTHKVVDKEEKGRGYEVSKGRYVEIEEDELKAVEIESTHTIDIDTFVPASEIDKRYFDHPYYIAPQGKAGAEAFVVIRNALKDKDRVALARIVVAHREHIIALEPLGKGILGTTLRYDYEVRDEQDYFSDIPSPKISKDMMQLAEHILDTKTGHFNAGRFKDRYESALRKLVLRKARGQKIEAPEQEETPSNVINLMDALCKSVEGERSRRRGRKRAIKGHASAKRHKKAA